MSITLQGNNMHTLQSVKYKRIKAILTSVGIEANDKDILMLVAEIDVAPQFICAAHIIPALFKDRNHEILNLKESIYHLNEKYNEVKPVQQGLEEDLNQANEATEYYFRKSEDMVRKHSKLVTEYAKLSEKLAKEIRTSTNQSMKITLLEDKLSKINNLISGNIHN